MFATVGPSQKISLFNYPLNILSLLLPVRTALWPRPGDRSTGREDEGTLPEAPVLPARCPPRPELLHAQYAAEAIREAREEMGQVQHHLGVSTAFVFVKGGGGGVGVCM